MSGTAIGPGAFHGPAGGVDKGDLADTVRAGMGAFADEALAREIASEFAARSARHGAAIRWLGGQGLLVQVRVGRTDSHFAGDPELVGKRRMLQMTELGIGGTPVDAMVSFLGGPGFFAELVSGYVEDRSLLQLYWMDGNGGIRSVVDPSAVGRRAFAIRGEQLLLQDSLRRIRDERWQALDRAAASGFLDAEASRIARKLIADARDAARRVADVDARLQEALARERRAAAALAWLDTAAMILDLAGQVSALKDMLGPDAPASPLDLSGHDRLVAYAASLKSGVTDGIVAIRTERTAVTTVYEESRRKFERFQDQDSGGPPGTPVLPGRLP